MRAVTVFVAFFPWPKSGELKVSMNITYVFSVMYYCLLKSSGKERYFRINIM